MSADHPVVSVVIVTRNAEKTLARALHSVAGLKSTKLEVIVVDGASTDGTQRIIKDFQTTIDTWSSEKDLGIYDAMNKGLRSCRGDWIYFLGSDDILLADLPSITARSASQAKAIYGSVLLADSDRIFGGRFSRTRLAFSNICHQAIIYHRSIFRDDKFDLQFPTLADYAFNMRHFRDFMFIEQVLAQYEGRTGLSSTKPDLRFAAVKKQLVLRYLGLFPYFMLLLTSTSGKILKFVNLKRPIKKLLGFRFIND